MALLSMNAHRMRTFLTMLGIIIGIASVVTVVALGNGSQQQILSNISSLGTNTITVFKVVVLVITLKQPILKPGSCRCRCINDTTLCECSQSNGQYIQNHALSTK
jgi:hypothetical protein